MRVAAFLVEERMKEQVSFHIHPKLNKERNRN